MAFREMGFDDDKIQVGQIEMYRGTKGRTDRIGMVLLKKSEKGEVRAVNHAAKVHFKDNYFLCLSSKEKTEVCCEKLGPSKHRFSTIVIHYETEKDGTLKKPFSYSIKLWVFGEDKYVQLRRRNREYPIANHDLFVSCKEEQFQQLDISTCKESIWQKKESLKKKVEEKARKLVPYLDKYIAKNLPKEDVLDQLGLDQQGAVVDLSSEEDFDDILESL